MKTYKMVEERQTIKDGTKTVWETHKRKEETLTEKHYRNMTKDDTQRYFRRLGGSEYAERSYTWAGYIVTRLVSKSPDRSERVVRTFEPIRVDKAVTA